MSSDSDEFGGVITAYQKNKNNIMRVLDDNGGEIPLSDIHTHLDISKSTVYKVVNGMEDEGLVDKHSMVTDPKRKKVVIPNGE